MNKPEEPAYLSSSSIPKYSRADYFLKTSSTRENASMTENEKNKKWNKSDISNSKLFFLSYLALNIFQFVSVLSDIYSIFTKNICIFAHSLLLEYVSNHKSPVLSRDFSWAAKYMCQATEMSPPQNILLMTSCIWLWLFQFYFASLHIMYQIYLILSLICRWHNRTNLHTLLHLPQIYKYVHSSSWQFSCISSSYLYTIPSFGIVFSPDFLRLVQPEVMRWCHCSFI